MVLSLPQSLSLTAGQAHHVSELRTRGRPEATVLCGPGLPTVEGPAKAFT